MSGAITAILLGLIWGSFANVVLTRLPVRQPLLWSRSRCPLCGDIIPWYDNIPIISYFWLRGRCRACGGQISWRYVLVEAAHGLLFLALWLRFGGEPLRLLVYGPAAVSLLLLAFFDLEQWWLPDIFLVPALIWGLVLALLVPPRPYLSSLLGAGLGFLTFGVLRWLYQRLTGRVGLGWGDVKLLAALGAYTGPGALPLLVCCSATAALCCSPIWLTQQGQGRLTRVPYGFFLSLAGIAYFLLADWLAASGVFGLEPLF